MKACQMVESCIHAASAQTDAEMAEFQNKLDKLEQRLLNLGQMRADGELTKEQFQKLYDQATRELESLKAQQSEKKEPEQNPQLRFGKNQKGLAQMIDISAPRISDELIDEFVEVITPVENHHYRWDAELWNAEGRAGTHQSAGAEKSAGSHFLPSTLKPPVNIGARNKMPPQFRRCDWQDLTVEVYL